MNDFFNIALIHEDEELMATCIQLAQANLKDQSDQYLLGENAWPHITLCEFMADSTGGCNPPLQEIWSSVENLQTKSLLLSFEHIYLRAGRGIHAGKIWVGLSVAKTVELIKLQKAVYETLHQLKIEADTKVDTYFPHLTWARCDGDKPITVSVIPPKELCQKQYAFNLSLGLSDINGVYRERLFSNHHERIS